ncbi:MULTISPECIES: hypothetical protein [unclassified Microcoleus]|uniref:hypothetical protein n=1 Tax=unclassified Microcoleus TaxID=2642155 RepID=UPI0025ED9AC4|nr:MULTISPECIES: hypothetical protein [unclassified Microcoleus]
MTTLSKEQTAIIRTERGLTIADKCITIYDIMDYVTAQLERKYQVGKCSRFRQSC